MRTLAVSLSLFAAGSLAAQSPPAPPSVTPEATAARVVTIGKPHTGTLTRTDALSRDSTYVQSWALHGEAGQTVTIELTSTDFDPYVVLQGPGIVGTRDYSDDDSGGRCNARLTVTFPQTGDYEIIVNTSGKVEVGNFTLAVLAGSKPKSLTRCNR